MKSRLPLPAIEAFNAEQRGIFDAIIRTRGSIDGPFLAWLHSPKLADAAQNLGAFCRFGSSLDTVESELLILLVAAHYDCLAEQQIHEPIALASGLHLAAVEAIRARLVPQLEGERLRLLLELGGQLLRTHRFDDAMYLRGQTLFGETTMVEIVGIIGYYTLVAYTLNAFAMVKE